MNKWNLLFALASSLIFLGCGPEEKPNVVCGRDWIKSQAVVVDTGSVFHISDPFIAQFRYGKPFDFGELEWAISDASGNVLASRKSKVTNKEGSYTVQGVSYHGGFMTAGEMLHSKAPGTFTIRFTTGGTLLAQKEVKLVLNSEQIDENK